MGSFRMRNKLLKRVISEDLAERKSVGEVGALVTEDFFLLCA